MSTAAESLGTVLALSRHVAKPLQYIAFVINPLCPEKTFRLQTALTPTSIRIQNLLLRHQDGAQESKPERISASSAYPYQYRKSALNQRHLVLAFSNARSDQAPGLYSTETRDDTIHYTNTLRQVRALATSSRGVHDGVHRM